MIDFLYHEGYLEEIYSLHTSAQVQYTADIDETMNQNKLNVSFYHHIYNWEYIKTNIRNY